MSPASSRYQILKKTKDGKWMKIKYPPMNIHILKLMLYWILKSNICHKYKYFQQNMSQTNWARHGKDTRSRASAVDNEDEKFMQQSEIKQRPSPCWEKKEAAHDQLHKCEKINRIRQLRVIKTQSDSLQRRDTGHSVLKEIPSLSCVQTSSSHCHGVNDSNTQHSRTPANLLSWG